MSNFKQIDDFGQLIDSVQKRSQKVQKDLAKIMFKGVTNPSLIEVLNDLKKNQPNFIRTGLTSLSCEAVGGTSELADNFNVMLALACVGVGIHDDIIDNTVYSRLRKSVPALHGSKRALLVGDLLIVKSWGLAQRMIAEKVNNRVIEQLLKVFEKSCIELCEAETDEVLYGRKLNISLKKRQTILWRINGILETCAEGGAIVGGGNKKQVAALGDFGRRLGFILALTDEVKDCLNLDGTLVHRLRNESIPFPMFYSAKSSANASLKIKNLLESIAINTSDVQDLVKLCFETGAFVYIQDLASQSKQNAVNSISSMKWNSSLSSLKLLIEKSLEDLASFCS
jgi:geranylgeranyl pyrophosphate synthase